MHIPSDVEATVERYSDSATSYVTLNRTNIAVYKQLYRAAKAKQKLKLRVTTKREPEPAPAPEPIKDIVAPKPVTIEDEPEEEHTAATPTKIEEEPKEDIAVKATEYPLPKPSGVAETVVAPQTNQDFPQFVAQWRARGNPRIHLRRNGEGVEVVDFLQSSSSTEPLVTRDSSEGTTAGTTTRVRASANLATLARSIEEREADAIKKNRLIDDRDFINSFRSLRIGSEPRSSTAASVTKSPESSNHAATEQADSAISSTSSINDSTNDKPEMTREMAKAIAIQEIMARSLMMNVPKPPTLGGPKNDAREAEAIAQQESIKRPFTVCCNSCDRAVPEAHFHCSICDDGDFDLCQDCVNRGISCHGEGHWLIKRTVVNGAIKCSSTHIAPKSFRSAPLKIVPKSVSPIPSTVPFPSLSPAGMMPSVWDSHFNVSARTCNSCVQEFREAEFVHCTTCDDYDLCKGCFAKSQHGHHPKHGFTAAVKGTVLDEPVSSRLAPGRNVLHNAICDGCDKYVRGIRHKCLDCPDWDYCSDCVRDANFIHPNHRFVAIYEPLADRPFRVSSRATHYGISCDGPLCKGRENGCRFIVGERYKCAVCHDTDFCANCEASPANTHNKTHPLIKFKTPVRHVSVTTTGEHEDGQRLPTMGDRCHRSRTATQSPNAPATPKEKIAATSVQTVVDVQPTEQPVVPVPFNYNDVDVKEEQATKIKPPVSTEPSKEVSVEKNLVAVFKWDTIQDSSVLPPNHTFEQTWVLRNEGTVPWPAGCSVKFVGGDYMGAVDPAHPAGIHELVSASESTICYNALNPGQEFPFTVLMRTPDRDGKVISYWRLTTPDGVKFGHKLWCDVVVEAPPKPEQGVAQTSDAIKPAAKEEEVVPTSVSESQMIIPKLEHESPSGSTFMDGRPELEVETETDTLAASADDEDDFEDCGQDDWAEDSASGFMTDEEYDILDASDEEFLFEQQKMLSKK